jgi:hypothetical protein
VFFEAFGASDTVAETDGRAELSALRRQMYTTRRLLSDVVIQATTQKVSFFAI